MDSCFSGLLLRLRGLEIVPGEGAGTKSPNMKPALGVRQVLTAGGEGEVVVEMRGHGLFTGVLLDGLGGGG